LEYAKETVIGATIGNYLVQKEVGHGGMGVVYIAEHPLIGRKVAVKVLKPDYSRNQEVVNRFFNEARATAQLKHPGLVEVLDFGYDADENAYLVMEFLEGESLAARLEREGRIPEAELAEIGKQAAAAVGAAHQQGIIHRDLKPDNLFLVPDAELGIRVKILDFGIAKLTINDDKVSVTQTGAVMGTPLYMSPEQAGGAGNVDPRADVYSLGCILFEMACGRPPFVKAGIGETIAAHIYEEPPEPRSLEPSISPALEGLILRALAKSSDERQQTMVELRHQLEHLDKPIAETMAAITKTSSPKPSAKPVAATITELDEAPPKNKLPLVPIAIGGVVIAGVLAVALTRHPDPPKVIDKPPPPAPVVAPVVEKAPQKIKLKIESEPAGAEVFRAADGMLVGMTPLTDERLPSTGKAVFLLKKSGFADGRAELDADRDGSAQIKLDKLHAKAPAPEKPKKQRVRDGAYDPYAK
jgi:serine/threonine-protein kinase